MNRIPPPPARYWRMVEDISLPIDTPYGKRDQLTFSAVYQPAMGPIRPNFRSRVGRGGRLMLDRIATGPGAPRRGRRQDAAAAAMSSSSSSDSDVSDVDEQAEAIARARREERFRYDDDVEIEFPTLSEPAVVDDFAAHYLLRRASLLKPVDFESLSVDGSYLEEALRWAALEPERLPPPVVLGRPPQQQAPPPRPVVNGVGVSMGSSAATAGAAAGPGGIPIQLPIAAGGAVGSAAGSPTPSAASFAAGARAPAQWRVAT